MTSGRPVVATNVDESFPLKEFGAGVVTEIDAEAMAEAVIRLLDDDRLAEELARKGVLQRLVGFDYFYCFTRQIHASFLKDLDRSP
jgi:glycosyltransferase involved in cell wall biosynthesis